MKVTFKDVGQGDSIILEWSVNGVNKIALVDCNKKGRINPVLDFLRESDYAKIEFAVLSHPHTDHYSGFRELLVYCENEGIPIGSFYHTVDRIGNKFWNFFEIDTEHKGVLKSFFTKADELHKKGLLEVRSIVEGFTIDLYDGAEILCMAPSHDDIKVCQSIMKYDPVTNTKEQSKAANYLSTILKLRIGDDYLLLTSDAEKRTFQTIVDRRKEVLENKRLLLCQMPHHGSFKNHEETFWKAVTNKPANPAVASAGQNHTYQHPHFDTLMAFHNNGYSVKSTTTLYGMQQYSAEMRRMGLQLEGVSSVAEEFDHVGDQVFEWAELTKEE